MRWFLIGIILSLLSSVCWAKTNDLIFSGRVVLVTRVYEPVAEDCLANFKKYYCKVPADTNLTSNAEVLVRERYIHKVAQTAEHRCEVEFIITNESYVVACYDYHGMSVEEIKDILRAAIESMGELDIYVQFLTAIKP